MGKCSKCIAKINSIEGASWRKRLVARLQPLGSRFRISLTPYGFRGGRNVDWVGFLWVSLGFPTKNFIPTFLHTHLIHFASFKFISPCDDATGMVGRHPYYSLTFNIRASSLPSLDPAPCRMRVQSFIFNSKKNK